MTIWVFPIIGGKLQNGWFIMETLLKWMIGGFSHIFGNTHFFLEDERGLVDRSERCAKKHRLFSKPQLSHARSLLLDLCMAIMEMILW